MFLSKFFFKSAKNLPPEITLKSHRLLYQGSYIKESVAGRYYYLPLGMMLRDNLVKMIEKELDQAGCLKMIAPVLHPKKLWEETNRDQSVGFELMAIKDRNSAEFVLGGTAEEMFVDLIRFYNLSYRDLPIILYQFSQKFRDELRARGGLLRLREFLMKDAYSFDIDKENFDLTYQKMIDVYFKIFQKLGLEAKLVEADNGYIGGEYCHEFIINSPVGESKYFTAPNHNYAAHEDVAVFDRSEDNSKTIQNLELVKAKRGNSIADGVNLHHLDSTQHLKNVVYKASGKKVIWVVIRGDLEVNETKIMAKLGVHNLEPLSDSEIKAIGSHVGFLGPVNLQFISSDEFKELILVADVSAVQIINAVSGANLPNQDYLNINYTRDWKADKIDDFALAGVGKQYLGEDLIEEKGIEVGNVFQLGLHYSALMQAYFTDKTGVRIPYYMGCYGIGIDRTLAAVIEAFDETGAKKFVWPTIIAPFQIEIILLSSSKIELAKKIYDEVRQLGISILLDDREISSGDKLHDADLIASPYRIIIGNKNQENEVEFIEVNRTQDILGFQDCLDRINLLFS